jgi:hydrogenase maturation protein HypF
MAKHIVVKGLVQGVGFRPFVYSLATRLNLHGWVRNTSAGVEIVIDGQSSKLEQFIQFLSVEKPALAIITSVEVEEIYTEPVAAFEIRPSLCLDDVYQPLSADLSICPDCERELFNPKNRRYLYPFINCAHCGPRFTIIKDIPHDRQNTTMSDFPMCDRCREEYLDPQNRRFHSPPIACPDCGPFVELRETHSQFPTSNPRISSIEIRVSAILKARRLLREGYIVAIKGEGGFHLACDAANPYTLAELRDRKGRSSKPFAVMAANIMAVTSICEMQRAEHLLLTSREKPIVLLAKKQTGLAGHKISELVAPHLDSLGVMLPDTPLHHLLLNETDPVLAREPVPPVLVMTSSNLSEEPIATDNKQALETLSTLADAFLLHNRDIHIRSDDSVAKVIRDYPVYLRRSRGYAPYPIALPCEMVPTLAVGGETKNTFCLARDRYAFLSHHIGDLRNAETDDAFEQAVQHLSHLIRVQPERITHDLHPDYFTTRYAERSTLPRLGVQHHHAHIASCMAENGLDNRRVIGLAFDGAGYGTDGALWGGEVLIASYADFERFAHLEYLPLPGGDPGLRSPWRIAATYAYSLGVDLEKLPFLQQLDKEAIRALRKQIHRDATAPLTSSMGRLFDAVASLIGVRNEITYEGQAAMELEALSRPFSEDMETYPYTVDTREGPLVVRLKDLFAGIVRDVRRSTPAGVIGARFHRTLAEVAIDLCLRARELTECNETVLSGGVWQNDILLGLVWAGLQKKGFTVFVHKQVPANDGGLALGQAIIAHYVMANKPPGWASLVAGEQPGNSI